MKRVTFKFKREIEISALVPDDFEEAEAKEIADSMVRTNLEQFGL